MSTLNKTKSKARDYKPSTIRRLDTLSGNQCAAPDCTNHLIARDGETIISKICHIEGASEKGPRYNPLMTDDERRHFNNLILLCDACHRIIDNKENESLYPVSLLKSWKKNHESKQLNKLNSNPSLLKIVINAIASIDLDDAYSNGEGLQVFNIGEKLDYNAVSRNRALIDEYKIYHAKINTLYAELESQASFKKQNLLRNINRIYLKVKGNYTKDANSNALSIIRANADNIIEDIEEILYESIKVEGDSSHEDISFGISIVMVDAFMRCKILEEPAVK